VKNSLKLVVREEEREAFIPREIWVLILADERRAR
jgi:hypothetical protein